MTIPSKKLAELISGERAILNTTHEPANSGLSAPKRAPNRAFSAAFALILLLILGFLIAACGEVSSPFECSDELGCVTIAPDEPLKLGALVSLSGDVAKWGIDQIRMLEIALARRDNQLLGHPVEIHREDALCSPEGGGNGALKIIADPQVVGIIGTTCSSAAIPAGKLMSAAGLVMVSGANAAPSLTGMAGKKGADWQPGYFRTIFNGAEEGRAAARFAFEELEVRQAATVDNGDPWAQGLADAFQRAFRDLGGEVVLSATVDKGDADMRPVLTAVADSGAEVLYIANLPTESAHIVRQAKEIPGLSGRSAGENLILIGTDLATEDFIEMVGPDGVGLYVFVFDLLQNAATEQLYTEYVTTYGEPPPNDFYLYSYDAANILLKAIETVTIIEEDGILHIGRQALRDALYATTDFEGVSGRLTCDQFGDCGVVRFNLVRLDDPSGGVEALRSNVVYTYTSER